MDRQTGQSLDGVGGMALHLKKIASSLFKDDLCQVLLFWRWKCVKLRQQVTTDKYQSEITSSSGKLKIVNN